MLVRFDEGNFLLKEVTFTKPLAELVYQAHKDDVIGRLSAVNELKSRIGNPEVVETWASRAAADSFWAVRQAALENLGKFALKDHMNLVKEALKDKNSRVRQSAVRILGGTRDPSWVKVFRTVYETDNSYVVQAEALRAIGKCGGKQQSAFLQRAQLAKSYRDVVANAAREALSALSK
jgi:aminopeptidase N